MSGSCFLLPFVFRSPSENDTHQGEKLGRSRAAQLEGITKTLDGFRHRMDVLEKKVDDGLWFDRLDDVAVIDKVRLQGPPRWKEKARRPSH